MHFLCDRAVLGYPRRHAAFPVRRTRLFAHALCNSPYALKQTQNMSGSVLLTTEASQTVCGDSRGQRYGIENLEIM